MSLRPRLFPAQVERFGAYFALGALFGGAYRRPVPTGIILSVLAIALELGQFLAPGRDPGLPDAIAKVAGAIAGVSAAEVARAILARRAGRR
jgi:VanZ family protein